MPEGVIARVSQRLLRTPKPRQDESFPGYLFRLAEENSYDSMSWIPERAGLKVYPAQGRWADLWRPGPIATYKGWQEKGRQVRKGEKAIELCRPITRSFENEQGEKEAITTGFIERPFWFVLSQTDGEPVEFPPTPEWDRSRALIALDIREVPFTDLDGNTLGYARGREIAISPLSPMPHETFFHECGHIIMGHCEEVEFRDNRHTPRNLREVEAEAVALICCESLNLPGAEYARGYIQSWIIGDAIPEKSARRSFHAADQILKAGQIA